MNPPSISKVRKYILDIKQFKKIKHLGSGRYGNVYSVEEISSGNTYAAKILNTQEADFQTKKMLNREIGIMTQCHHPTIVKLYGYSIRDFDGNKNTTIIMEYARKGSLYDLLNSLRNGTSEDFIDNTIRQIILIGISRGMMYLHKNGIIHRDLKPGNI